MNVAIPEIDELKNEIKDLKALMEHMILCSGQKQTVTIQDIAQMEGVCVRSLYEGGTERYLLPNFGESEFPTGRVRWNLTTYIAWHRISPMEKKRAWEAHLRAEAERYLDRKAVSNR